MRRPSIFSLNEIHPIGGRDKIRKPKVSHRRAILSPPARSFEVQHDKASDHPPTFEEQAAAYGAEVGIFSTPNIRDTYFFNPTLVDFGSRRWVLFRRSFFNLGPWKKYRTTVSRFELLGDMTLGPEIPLQIPKGDLLEQTDDPRCSIINGKIHLGVCSWITPVDGKPIAVRQKVMELHDWLPRNPVEVPYGFNGQRGKSEKNWLWFEHDQTRHCVYQSDPMTVLREEGGQFVEEYRTPNNFPWGFGQIRGGTPPILIGDEYLTFFHSSLPWKIICPAGMRNRYYMGAMTFQAKPPFSVTRLTPQPMLVGTFNERHIPISPPCVFPSGALLNKGKWLVSYGINDVIGGWMKIDHSTVEKLLTPA